MHPAIHFGSSAIVALKQSMKSNRDPQQKKEVLKESDKIYGVKKVIPTIYLVSDLSRSKG